MLTPITQENLRTLVNNSQFRAYAERYTGIQEQFYRQVETFGLPFDFENGEAYAEKAKELTERLSSLQGVDFYNNAKSICSGPKSSACKACAKGIGTATLFLSFQCHRDCYFCFNPNQSNYEYYRCHKNDWKKELDQILASGETMTHLALTGGEPLLYKDDAIAFFQYVKDHFTDVHTRLYTAGDLLTPEILQGLKDAGLHEIRFSIKLEDTKEKQQGILDKMAEAKKYIPDVMVEMPVIPGHLEEMKELLVKLDEIGIYGINLLEFCFPLNNADAFAENGFKIKYPPHQVLYNFWYAGGLPISGSEVEALELVIFAAEKGLKLGAHYCSLENKHFGQIYRQNTTWPCMEKTMVFSEKDFYLKTAKVFGNDTKPVKDILKKAGVKDYEFNNDYHFLQFHPKHIPLLKGTEAEIGISFNVQEYRDDAPVLRELKCDYTTPDLFQEGDL